MDDSGLSSIWFYEVPLEEETFARAGFVAALTSRMKIGAGIFSPLFRHPAQIAMAAASLDNLSGGRGVLVLGAGVREWLEQKLRIPYRQPRHTLEDALPIIRRLLAGETVDYGGRNFSLSGKLDFPPQRRDLPIFIAAGHEYLLRYSGKTADGVLLYFWPPLEYLKWAARQVQITSEGRRVEIGAFVPLRITNDKATARKELKPELAYYFSERETGPLFLEKGGFESQLGEQLRKLWASPGYRSGDPSKIMPLIPDELVDEFALIGSVQEIRERIKSYQDAGMTFMVLAFQSKFDEYIKLIPELLS